MKYNQKVIISSRHLDEHECLPCEELNFIDVKNNVAKLSFGTALFYVPIQEVILLDQSKELYNEIF